MGKLRTRLSIIGLEDRLTPASTTDFLSAAGQTAAASAFFEAIAEDPGWIFNSAARPFLVERMQSIYQGAQGAIQTFEAAKGVWNAQIQQNPAFAEQAGPFMYLMGGFEARAQAVASIAVHVGDMLGFAVAPAAPAPTTPTTPTTPTDAGMTDVMPSATAPQWQTQPSGLKTWDVVTGTGDPVAAGDSITVFYTGWLASNGTKFDSRRSPAAPVTFSLNGLIQGWQEGIVGMKPGGIRRLYVPSNLGYGAAGSPPNIPANADLIFEIKLISHT